MMFRFNFQADSVEGVKNAISDHQDQVQTPCEEIAALATLHACTFKPIYIDNVEFFVRDLENEADETNKSFMKSYKDCDVIPQIYEGGLKVWECTYDLLLFLMRNSVDFKNKTVLDLGCGCGLVGIFAGMKGAEVVHFQDYNVDVLTGFTIPNVQRNKVKSVTKFFSGDWSSFARSSFVESVQYDCIVTSETLYNTNNYSKLCDLFVSKLKKQGTIYVATKSYYFGIGGSVQRFQEHLSHYTSLRSDPVWKTGEGIPDLYCCF